MTAGDRKRSERIYWFIVNHVSEHGYAPTTREIARAVGLRSTSAVEHHLHMLEHDGYIRHTPKIARSIVVLWDRSRERRKG
jgi:repressor LexA